MFLAHGLNGWVFLFGATVHTASLIKLERADGMFFPTQRAAIAAARAHGLLVTRSGQVHADPAVSAEELAR